MNLPEDLIIDSDLSFKKALKQNPKMPGVGMEIGWIPKTTCILRKFDKLTH